MNSTNKHGFRGNNDNKTNQIIKTIEDASIDTIIINETNYKWISSTIDNTWNEFVSASNDVSTSTSDRKYNYLTQNYYLSSVTLATTFGIFSIYVVETSKTSDKLGKWNTLDLKYENKIIIVINLWPFPGSSRK